MNVYLMESAKKQTEICRIIANPRRLLILWLLSEGELSVNDIAAKAGSSLQNVSQHLGILKNANVIIPRREGQTIFYQLSDEGYFKNCPVIKNVPGHLDEKLEPHQLI